MTGSALKKTRQRRGWSQLRAIAEIEMVAAKGGRAVANRATLKKKLSMWENGHARPSHWYVDLLCEAYQASETDLGFTSNLTSPVLSAAPRASESLITYFDGVLTHHLAADNLMGPLYLVDVVKPQAGLLTGVLADTPAGRLRHDLVALACQYQEFLGWLLQDAGFTDAARSHTDRAMDLAMEAGDITQITYILMRKTHLAIDCGDSATGMAEAAQRHLPTIPERVRALVLVQAARAAAADGDTNRCQALLDKARDHSIRQDRDHDPLAGYCSISYIETEAAACWLRLGQPDTAAEILSRYETDWSSQHRRDHGVSASRLALAHSLSGNTPDAITAGATAVDLVSQATSSRSLLILQRLSRSLPRTDEAAELHHRLQTLMNR